MYSLSNCGPDASSVMISYGFHTHCTIGFKASCKRTLQNDGEDDRQARCRAVAASSLRVLLTCCGSTCEGLLDAFSAALVAVPLERWMRVSVIVVKVLTTSDRAIARISNLPLNPDAGCCCNGVVDKSESVSTSSLSITFGANRALIVA